MSTSVGRRSTGQDQDGKKPALRVQYCIITNGNRCFKVSLMYKQKMGKQKHGILIYSVSLFVSLYFSAYCITPRGSWFKLQTILGYFGNDICCSFRCRSKRKTQQRQVLFIHDLYQRLFNSLPS